VDPSIVFQTLVREQPRSLIFTSGTLKPFDTFAKEIGIDFDVSLENLHVIRPSEQVQLTIVKSPNPKEFVFTHEGRQNEHNFDYTGEALFKIAKNTPNGILVAFASSSLMKLHIEYWRQIGTDYFGHLERIKQVFIEPNSSHECERVVKEYRRDGLLR
jgi:regulator of telomere elongation helicase 1